MVIHHVAVNMPIKYNCVAVCNSYLPIITCAYEMLAVMLLGSNYYCASMLCLLYARISTNCKAYGLMYQVSVSNPFENPIAKRLYDEWLGQPGSENAKKYLHTKYHPVVKSVASQLQNW